MLSDEPPMPFWLDLWLVDLVHSRSLGRHGGARGKRDAGALQSAVSRPRGKWQYAEPRPDLFDLAAAYAFGLARGKPYNDANRRTAWNVVVLFLDSNGVALEPMDHATIVVALHRLSSGHMSEDQFAAWLRARAQ